MTDLPAPGTHIPPHHSDLTLTTVKEEERESYFQLISRGFHGEYHTEDFEFDRKNLELDRSLGFRSGDRWVSTAFSFGRRLSVPGGSVGAAAVTAVTVAPGFRRRGILTQMMKHQLADVAARGTEPVALLWASESSIYGRFGYGRATTMLKLSGLTRETAFLPEVDLGPGSVDEASQVEFLAVVPSLRHSMRFDRPGHLDRDDAWWQFILYDPERFRGGAGPRRFALHFAEDGTTDGFATFRTKRDSSLTDYGREVQIDELDATNPSACAALWRWLLDLDLVRAFSRGAAPVDEPLLQFLADPRRVKTEISDALYARLLDVPAALQARSYASDVDLVLEVEDGFLPESGGRFRIEAGTDGSAVTRTHQTPDVTLTARQLGAIYLGGTSPQAFARAGLLTEHTKAAVQQLTVGFGSPRAPYCPDFF